MTEKMEEQIAQSMYNQIEEEVEVDEIEEGEEETFRLDFEKGVATQVEETLIVGENVVSDTMKQVEAPIPTKPAEPTFENELSEFFMQTLTSKAVSSLINKLHKAETEMHEAITIRSPQMGVLSSMLEDDMFKQVDSRRKELRAAYGFGMGRVYYDKIPEWAKGYVKNYIRGFVGTAADLMEDVE